MLVPNNQRDSLTQKSLFHKNKKKYTLKLEMWHAFI